MAVLQMVFADLTGSDTVTPKVDISDMAPEAPRGWYATPYKTADGEEITKARFFRSPIAKTRPIRFCSSLKMQRVGVAIQSR